MISIYFFLLILNFDFLIYAVYVSLLSFAISIFFNILELKKNKENLNFSNQILLENKKVFNLFFLKETSTIYYLFGTLSFYYLYKSPSEINWVLLPLFTVFAIDTLSYFIGSKFGKRKISFLEIISPNKTLIGFITAFITGSCVFYSLNYFFFNVFSYALFIISNISK